MSLIYFHAYNSSLLIIRIMRNERMIVLYFRLYKTMLQWRSKLEMQNYQSLPNQLIVYIMYCHMEETVRDVMYLPGPFTPEEVVLTTLYSRATCPSRTCYFGVCCPYPNSLATDNFNVLGQFTPTDTFFSDRTIYSGVICSQDSLLFAGLMLVP